VISFNLYEARQSGEHMAATRGCINWEKWHENNLYRDMYTRRPKMRTETCVL